MSFNDLNSFSFFNNQTSKVIYNCNIPKECTQKVFEVLYMEFLHKNNLFLFGIFYLCINAFAMHHIIKFLDNINDKKIRKYGYFFWEFLNYFSATIVFIWTIQNVFF